MTRTSTCFDTAENVWQLLVLAYLDKFILCVWPPSATIGPTTDHNNAQSIIRACCSSENFGLFRNRGVVLLTKYGLLGPKCTISRYWGLASHLVSPKAAFIAFQSVLQSMYYVERARSRAGQDHLYVHCTWLSYLKTRTDVVSLGFALSNLLLFWGAFHLQNL